MTRTLGRISSAVEYGRSRMVWRRLGTPPMNEASSSRSIVALESVLVRVGSKREEGAGDRGRLSSTKTFREPIDPIVVTDIARARAFGSKREALPGAGGSNAKGFEISSGLARRSLDPTLPRSRDGARSRDGPVSPS